MPPYEKRLIAFIDILGFKSLITNSVANAAKLDAIYEALQLLKESEKPESWSLKFIEVEEDAQKKGVSNFGLSNNITCTCFSDSILISAPVSNANINEITSTLIANIAYTGMTLLSKGILLRGGFTIGELLHERDGVIMGKGLIEAYEIETNTSKNARIVLSEKLLKMLNYPLLLKKNRYPYHQYLQRFEDGCVGFHQMIILQVIQTVVDLGPTELKDYIIKVRSTIINGLNQNLQSPDIFNKYNWMKDYFNKLIIFEEGCKSNISDYFTDHQIFYV